MLLRRNMAVALVAMMLARGAPVPADVVLDGTVGVAGPLPGPAYAIEESHGTRPGGGPNLFHSFLRFNLTAAESATFNGSAGIERIVARVTGQASSIDGLLQSTVADADLYLVNPRGIVFGPNAALDVTGAFRVATANYVQFADGGRFDASSPGASTLTSAPPAAFGFLGGSEAVLDIAGATFATPVGGDLFAAGSRVEVRGAGLRAPGAALTLVAATSGQVPVAAPHDGAYVGGVVAVSDGSVLRTDVDVAGNTGDLLLRAGEVTIEDSEVGVVHGAAGHGGRLVVQADDGVAVRRSSVYTESGASGRAGDVRIETREVTIADRSEVYSLARSFGRAGDVAVTADDITVVAASVASRTRGAGAAGNVTVSGGAIRIDDAAQVDVATEAQGAGGRLEVTASRSLELRTRDPAGPTSGLFSSTLGAGRAGNVVVTAPVISLYDGAITARSQGTGAAGSVIIRAGRLVLEGGGQIDASTFTDAAGGNVDIVATERVEIGGRDASPQRFRSGVFVSTEGGGGDAGNLDLQAPTVTVRDHGIVSAGNFAPASGAQAGSGDGGTLTIRAGVVQVRDGGEITVKTEGSGDGGAMTIAADRILVGPGGIVSSQSDGGGNAGTLALQAVSAVEIDGGGAVTTEARLADGGNVVIRARDLVLVRGAITTAVGSGQGNGGNIDIDPQFVIVDGGRIIADAFGGDGGNIDIVAGAFIVSPDSVISASSRFGVDGQITIDSPEVDVAGGLVVLPAGYFDASRMLRERCAARGGQRGSSLALAGGRSGFDAPDGLLPVHLSAERRLEPSTGWHAFTPGTAFACTGT